LKQILYNLKGNPLELWIKRLWILTGSL